MMAFQPISHWAAIRVSNSICVGSDLHVIGDPCVVVNAVIAEQLGEIPDLDVSADLSVFPDLDRLADHRVRADAAPIKDVRVCANACSSFNANARGNPRCRMDLRGLVREIEPGEEISCDPTKTFRRGRGRLRMQVYVRLFSGERAFSLRVHRAQCTKRLSNAPNWCRQSEPAQVSWPIG